MSCNWQCRSCGERGDEAVESPPFLPSGLTCLADQSWFTKDYPKGMKHHWSDGTPLSIDDGKLWWALSSAPQDDPTQLETPETQREPRYHPNGQERGFSHGVTD